MVWPLHSPSFFKPGNCFSPGIRIHFPYLSLPVVHSAFSFTFVTFNSFTHHPRISTSAITAAGDEVFHIDCHTDPDTLKGFILWDDIQQVSSEVLFIRNETKVVPFMKGTDLRMLVLAYHSQNHGNRK